MDVTALVVSSIPGSIVAYFSMLLLNRSAGHLRAANAESEAVKLRVELDRAKSDIEDIEQRLAGAECEIAALQATVNK